MYLTSLGREVGADQRVADRSLEDVATCDIYICRRGMVLGVCWAPLAAVRLALLHFCEEA